MIVTVKQLANHLHLSNTMTRVYLDKFNAEKIKQGRRVYYNLPLKKIEAIKRFISDKSNENVDETKKLKIIISQVKKEIDILYKKIDKMREFAHKKKGQYITSEEVFKIIGE